MKKSILSILLSILLGGAFAHGANHNVGAGQSIQAAINSASAGDVINLTAPVDYNGDLNITKPLRILSLLNANQNVNGNLNIEAIPAGQSVTLKNLVIGGTIVAKNSSLNLLKCTLSSTVTATNPAGVDTQLTFVRSTIVGKLTSKLNRSWVGYSNLRQSAFEGIVEIVGNDFNGNGLGGIGIDLNATHTNAKIHNNLIRNFNLSSHVNISSTCIGIRVRGGTKAEIRNNTIRANYDSQDKGTETYVGIGIFVQETALTTISSNILSGNYVEHGTANGHCNIYAPRENVVVRHNAMDSQKGSSLVKGGAEHYDTVSSVSEGSGFLSNTVAQMAGRPGRNKGSPEDYHKDHDGSRNDIGSNGGRNYVPDGRTTAKPIPIYFSIAPIAVPAGGVITIQSTGATVK